MQTYDAVVLGLGTMGSFACLNLARRGLKVAGFDQFEPPHGRGSHSGDTRVFRIAYAEHPDYVPLAQRASDLWDLHAAGFGIPLLHRTGMLSMGPADGILASGIAASARLHNLEIEQFSATQIKTRYPAFAPLDDWVGMFEPTAGWVDVNASIEGAINAARHHGAQIFLNTAVNGWVERNGRLHLDTPAGPIETARLVITAGAWATRALRDVNLPLAVRRKILVWIDPANPKLFESGHFPVFAIADRFFYGFPNLGHGVKLAVHWEEGVPVVDPSGGVPPPAEADLEPVIDLALRYLPGLVNSPIDGLTRVRRAATCLYTMTPDEHFIVDRHPSTENVWIAAGFSGHGFKFAPAIGEALADLAVDGRTTLPIGFLSLDRFR